MTDANGMVEALVLWESVANSNWFAKSSMILFLNKADVFSAKIRDPQQQIHSTFPDYNGKPGNYQDGVHYFKKRFEGLSKGQKEVYVHVTTAVCPFLLLGKTGAD
jgi:guanine nucleotide-binding protein subunit alpha